MKKLSVDLNKIMDCNVSINDVTLLDCDKLTEKWSSLAHVLSKINVLLTPYVQGLGRIHKNLTDKEIVFVNYMANNPMLTVDNCKEFGQVQLERSDNTILAQLWVMGCYEVIRALEQHFREDSALNSTPAATVLFKAKKLFEKVRIPLAKFEKPNSSKEDDFSVALPGYTPSEGTTWLISNGKAIGRKYLAQTFISALQAIAYDLEKE